jgi:transposase
VATIRNHIVIASPPAALLRSSCHTSHGSGIGVFRWVVERTLAWLHRFRRLAVRYERHDRVHHAFLTLRCALICWNYLKSTGRVF